MITIGIVEKMLQESDAELKKARKLDEDEDFTNIDTTTARFYEEGYRDALAYVLRELRKGGE